MLTSKPNSTLEDEPYNFGESFNMRQNDLMRASADFDDYLEGYSCPEKTLLAAVLWRAYWDLFSNVESKDRISAILWFEGITESAPGFSYEHIKEILDINKERQLKIDKAIKIARNGKEFEHEYLADGTSRYYEPISRPGHFINV